MWKDGARRERRRGSGGRGEGRDLLPVQKTKEREHSRGGTQTLSEDESSTKKAVSEHRPLKERNCWKLPYRQLTTQRTKDTEPLKGQR